MDIYFQDAVLSYDVEILNKAKLHEAKLALEIDTSLKEIYRDIGRAAQNVLSYMSFG